jgi:hypothetical protein
LRLLRATNSRIYNQQASGGNSMADSEHSNATDPGDERIPAMQRILDNPFLLLFLGVVMPTVFYVIWGIMEIVTIPIAK